MCHSAPAVRFAGRVGDGRIDPRRRARDWIDIAAAFDRDFVNGVGIVGRIAKEALINLYSPLFKKRVFSRSV